MCLVWFRKHLDTCKNGPADLAQSLISITLILRSGVQSRPPLPTYPLCRQTQMYWLGGWCNDFVGPTELTQNFGQSTPRVSWNTVSNQFCDQRTKRPSSQTTCQHCSLSSKQKRNQAKQQASKQSRKQQTKERTNEPTNPPPANPPTHQSMHYRPCPGPCPLTRTAQGLLG